MACATPAGSGIGPEPADPRPSDSWRGTGPGPWWSTLLGEWVDEPTQPLPLVGRPETDRPDGRGGPQ